MPENVSAIAEGWLQDFGHFLTSGNVDATVASFHPTGWLRDVLIFGWDTRSLFGHENISTYLRNTLYNTEINSVHLDGRTSLLPSAFSVGLRSGIEFSFTFDTRLFHGRGHVRLIQEHNTGGWKALSVFVMADNIKGAEETGPELGVYEGHTVPWEHIRSERRGKTEKDPYVVIVGAGQTGLQVAARFKQMSIPTLIIHKDARVGDQWRRRYRSLSLHTPRSHSSLLYQPFPSNWPTYTPKERLATWLECYALTQDLLIWDSTTIATSPKPTYDPGSRKWTIAVVRGGEIAVLRPAHIVLATGTLGKPHIPRFPLEREFSGSILHACEFEGAEGYEGKRVLVVGAANTGADVAQDLYVTGAAEVTILQRSSTCLVSSNWSKDNFRRNFPEGRDTEVSDFKLASMPWGLTEQVVLEENAAGKEDMDAELKERLALKGLKTNDGRDGLGRPFLVVERFAGHWIDVGCADLILQDKVKVKSGTEIDHFVKHGVVFKDGSTLSVDAVIYATGYESVRDVWKEIFGDDLVEAAGGVWGLDAERELRGVYRPTGQPGLWFCAGDFHHSRWMSKQLAIQIKARQMGLLD